MKVCFISNAFIREREVLQGINKETDFLFVCPYYTNANFTKQDVTGYCEEHSINLILHDFTKRRARSLKGIVPDFILVKKLRDFRPDIVYIETQGSPYLALFYRLLLGNRRTIISIMDYKLHQRGHEKTFRFSERFYRYIQISAYNYFHFFSNGQDALFKKDHPHKKSFVIRLFLVDKQLHSTALRTSLDNHINILFFGRIYYYKGIDILIKAVNLLQDKYSNFTVTIAGVCNTWSEEYEPLIKSKDRFNLLIRHIEKDELPDLYGRSDYFVAPYREVTQSGPLMRAYNYDMIPIVSNEDGFNEYVEDGKTGFVFNSNSPESCASALERALVLPKPQREEMLINIRQFKNEEFAIDKVVERYIKMFRAIAHS